MSTLLRWFVNSKVGVIRGLRWGDCPPEAFWRIIQVALLGSDHGRTTDYRGWLTWRRFIIASARWAQKWGCTCMFICAFITQAKTKEEARHPRTESRLLENMTKDPISEFFLNQKNPNICSGATGYISSEEIFSFSNDNDSRPSNFLFQIARGSGATLSECTFSSKERTTLKRLSRQDHSKASRRKNPDQAWFTRQSLGNKEAFEFNHEMLGGLSMRDPWGTSQGKEKI